MKAAGMERDDQYLKSTKTQQTEKVRQYKSHKASTCLI